MKYACYTVLVLFAACAREEATERGSAPIPVPAPAPQGDGGVEEEVSDDPASYGFRGSITELRQLEPAREGLYVLLQDVVILSASKPKGLFYVADALGGEYAGIEVSLCQACRHTSADVAVTVNVSGVLRLESGDRYIIEQAHFVVRSHDRAEVPKVPIPTALAMTPGTARFVGGYVQLVDAQTDEPSHFVVVDRAPVAATNEAYPMRLDATCSFEEAQSVACCEFGPKFTYFIVEDSRTQARINVATAPFQSFGSARAWPCDANDVANVIKVGDAFASLAGIIDVQNNTTVIVPTSPADCPLQR
jgi:hypothetical protein